MSSSSPSGGGEWESFHQQEDLTTRLHNILEEYPAGVGIFKEFLQNADDAGAKKFAILWDRQSHRQAQPGSQTQPHHSEIPGDGAGAAAAEGLLSASLDEWQGPALYVYNDATFSDGDFESISHVHPRTIPTARSRCCLSCHNMLRGDAAEMNLAVAFKLMNF